MPCTWCYPTPHSPFTQLACVSRFPHLGTT
nr:MAG TPA: hypothetical protein [Caudoviricetes sp.]